VCLFGFVCMSVCMVSAFLYYVCVCSRARVWTCDCAANLCVYNHAITLEGVIDVNNVIAAFLNLLPGLAVYVIRGVRRDGQNRPPGGQLPDEETSLLQPTTSSSVYREDKPPRDRKSFIFGDDIFNGSSPLP